MKHIPLIVLSVITWVAKAQDNPQLKSLVDAERAFINMAKEKNTRDAFTTFLADDAVTFGTEIQKGKAYLSAQPQNDSWLLWEPVYSVVAASEDFGFNTGPWEFRAKKTDDKAIAFGQFITVWKKVNGEWKVALDIGVSHKNPSDKESWRTSSVKSASGPAAGRDDIMKMERTFEADVAQNSVAAYKKFLSPEARLYRTDQKPFTSPQQVDAYVSTVHDKVSFTAIDGSIASSGDLAFVYGRAVVHEQKPREAFFMRIWRLENGSWKIVLDIIS